jgi:UDP-3-O-[3-hydroxymyristoyl] N-acetylglucosamine deacetylase
MAKRRTLAGEAFAEGVTLHAGVRVHMRLAPAAPGHGIAFRRSDMPGSALIPALWSNVTETRRGTVLRGGDGTSIGVVEHLLSAAAGIGIDDCLVEIDGPEPPILDGDALCFVHLIDKAGLREVQGPRDMIRVLKEVGVAAGDASARLLPATQGEFFFEIEFPSAAIGKQTFQCPFTEAVFRRDIAPARTFGFLHEAASLREAGYGRGADLTNALVIDGNRLLNPELRRFPDEFVRHKILDAIGDLKLAGAALIARFEGHRSSHTLNNALLRALFADPGNYERVAV